MAGRAESDSSDCALHKPSAHFYPFFYLNVSDSGCRLYLVDVFAQRLHRHQLPRLVDAVNCRLKLHSVAQLLGHALADLTGTTHKLPFLQKDKSNTCYILDFCFNKRCLSLYYTAPLQYVRIKLANINVRFSM